ncbi:hypothetical protein POJ06DRAFT_251603 [Lipomyces tetrasporus]|uniref:Uncharacterized protein n=1 Tax=Lipomyces tetrasporus TaxID=54092 RepID=A0AAD7QUB9_9ASCO|nr:uncharacterized protein POJ06DRAFT_251603 [Lipomyces tetrasporus]KAJ8101461.1 hypothetical protein POJ06DRAFT_251603 [Lipomyces tetrasporus]
MSSLFRRLLYPYAATSVPVGRDVESPGPQNADGADGAEIPSENWTDWDATLAEYEIITPCDADILTQPGTNLTIDLHHTIAPVDVDMWESESISAGTSSTSCKASSPATSSQEDYLDLHVRPLTYVEAFLNGLPSSERHLRLGARQGQSGAAELTRPTTPQSAKRLIGTRDLKSRKFETKMFNLGSGAWHMAMPPEDDEDRYLFTDRKVCRSRQREKSLVMDKRARLRALMV